jgi:hypothetical protein
VTGDPVSNRANRVLDLAKRVFPYNVTIEKRYVSPLSTKNKHHYLPCLLFIRDRQVLLKMAGSFSEQDILNVLSDLESS